MSLALNNFNDFVQDLSASVVATEEINTKVTSLFKGFKAKKKPKSKMGVFESTLTEIYSKTETTKLESIFEQKKEEFYASKTYDYNQLVRYKEMEILRVIRKELAKRGIEVDILR